MVSLQLLSCLVVVASASGFAQVLIGRHRGLAPTGSRAESNAWLAAQVLEHRPAAASAVDDGAPQSLMRRGDSGVATVHGKQHTPSLGEAYFTLMRREAEALMETEALSHGSDSVLRGHASGVTGQSPATGPAPAPVPANETSSVAPAPATAPLNQMALDSPALAPPNQAPATAASNETGSVAPAPAPLSGTPAMVPSNETALVAPAPAPPNQAPVPVPPSGTSSATPALASPNQATATATSNATALVASSPAPPSPASGTANQSPVSAPSNEFASVALASAPPPSAPQAPALAPLAAPASATSPLPGPIATPAPAPLANTLVAAPATAAAAPVATSGGLQPLVQQPVVSQTVAALPGPLADPVTAPASPPPVAPASGGDTLAADQATKVALDAAAQTAAAKYAEAQRQAQSAEGLAWGLQQQTIAEDVVAITDQAKSAAATAQQSRIVADYAALRLSCAQKTLAQDTLRMEVAKHEQLAAQADPNSPTYRQEKVLKTQAEVDLKVKAAEVKVCQDRLVAAAPGANSSYDKVQAEINALIADGISHRANEAALEAAAKKKFEEAATLEASAAALGKSANIAAAQAIAAAQQVARDAQVVSVGAQTAGSAGAPQVPSAEAVAAPAPAPLAVGGAIASTNAAVSYSPEVLVASTNATSSTEGLAPLEHDHRMTKEELIGIIVLLTFCLVSISLHEGNKVWGFGATSMGQQVEKEAEEKRKQELLERMGASASSREPLVEDKQKKTSTPSGAGNSHLERDNDEAPTPRLSSRMSAYAANRAVRKHEAEAHIGDLARQAVQQQAAGDHGGGLGHSNPDAAAGGGGDGAGGPRRSAYAANRARTGGDAEASPTPPQPPLPYTPVVIPVAPDAAPAPRHSAYAEKREARAGHQGEAHDVRDAALESAANAGNEGEASPDSSLLSPPAQRRSHKGIRGQAASGPKHSSAAGSVSNSDAEAGPPPSVETPPPARPSYAALRAAKSSGVEVSGVEAERTPHIDAAAPARPSYAATRAARSSAVQAASGEASGSATAAADSAENVPRRSAYAANRASRKAEAEAAVDMDEL